MKRLMLGLGLLLIALLAVACGGSGAAPSTAVPERVEVPVEVTRIVEGTAVTEIQVVTATPEPVAEPTALASSDTETYTWVTFGEPETFDPALNYESAGGGILQNTYETLITYDGPSADRFVPQLATEWEISEDGTEYTFTIREGVRFHEGQELTSEDVAYTFQRGILQGGPESPQALLTEPLLGLGIYDVTDLVDATGALAGDVDALAAADAATLQAACETVQNAIVDNGDGTVTFKLAQPYAPFLPTLANYWGSITSKEWIMENSGWDGDCATWQNFYGVSSESHPLTDKINGTGPYKLERWSRGEEIVLVANEDYWRTEEIGPAWEGGPVGVPAIKRVVIQSVDEWGTRFAVLQAGDADSANVPRENATQVDPLVGERCDFNGETLGFDCKPTDTPDQPLRLYIGFPQTSRTDAFFTFDINAEGGNPLIGSGQLDGNGIPPDFFTDIHVRKGFNYCFDWDTYIQETLLGEAEQNVGPILIGRIGYDPDGPKYNYDPEACAEELSQAWEGKLPETGFRFQIGYNTGNTTRQVIAEILQAGLGEVNELYTIEVIGLPWANFLRQQRESRLPIFISGWGEDIADPHNWAQPMLVGTYGARQRMPDEMLAEFQELVTQGVSATDDEARADVYQQIGQLDYENAPAIRLAVALGRYYQQRWVQGWYYNPQINTDAYYYALSKK